MDLIKKANKLGYKHYTEFTIKELDKLPLKNANKQIEYYFIQKWLREEHNIEVYTNRSKDFFFYKYTISNIATGVAEELKGGYEYKTYEEALEKGLQTALKLI